ncbi:ParA family protein [Roseixanthobacter liquoris]|uniref:ParA family protein n=1 Tax=Roseixanthobacter liquoris TaxID=3119921 RepID=UPI00372931DD
MPRPGRVIAVANMKGGVGKTTTVVMLAEALAADGNRVLVIDLDAQASVSYSLGGNALLRELFLEERTISYFLEDVFVDGKQRKISNFIRNQVTTTTYKSNLLNVSLIAADPTLRYVERYLLSALIKKGFDIDALSNRIWKRMEREMPPLKQEYDYIFFDCAPGISLLTEVAIRGADMVLIPTIPDSMSTLGLSAFSNSFWRGPLARSTPLPMPKRLPYVLFSRCQNIRTHNLTRERMRLEVSSIDPPYYMLKTIIPQAAILADVCTDQPGRTFQGKYGPVITTALNQLLGEMKDILDGHPS